MGLSYTLTSSDLAPGYSSPPQPRQALPDELVRRLTEGWFGNGFRDDSWNDGNNWNQPWSGGFGYRPSYVANGTTSDRRSGRNMPLYWSEVDLRGFRVLSRYLCDTNMFMLGFMGRLVDYHIRKGFGWQACRKGARKTAYPTLNTDDPVITKGQSVLDQFRDKAKWPIHSREAFKRWRRDGEVFDRWFKGGRGELPSVRFVEPEQVGSPDGATDGPLSYGIETDPDDVCTILSYFVRDMEDNNPASGQWVDADSIVYAKCNVDSAVKRGLPDAFPVHEMLDGTRRLLRNVLETSIAQAAVAWREKFPTATQAQVQGLIPQWGMDSQTPTGQYPNNQNYPGWPATGNQVRGGARNAPPGYVARVEGNREFEEGPTAAGIPNYIQVEQAVLRGCGARWGMPEYFSGDASNNNFASSLVAGSPFAVAVEGCQLEWGCFERASALKVFELAYRSGILAADEYRQLDVEVTEPSVVTADPEKETAQYNVEHSAGVLSATTWQLKRGYDPQHEQANFDAERAQGMQPGADSGLGGDPNDPNAQQRDDGGVDALLPADGDGGSGMDGLFPESLSESQDDSGHQHKSSGPGGGQFTSGGGGGGGGGEKKGGGGEGNGHNVKLPANKKKLKIDDAAAALDQMGYKLGKARTDLKTKQTFYHLTLPDGRETWASVDEVRELVYRGAKAHQHKSESLSRKQVTVHRGGKTFPAEPAGE